MVKAITVGTLACALAVGGLPMEEAQARGWRWDHCRFATRDGHRGASMDEVKTMIRCAFGKTAPGQTAEALCVAQRESGYNENADNPTSSAAGVFQFVSGTWDGVKARYRDWWRHHDLRRSVYNARANVMAAARYQAAVGWSPWGGGC